jgi:cytochrome c-type biogenesis protein CcmH/NrfF
VTLPLAHLGHYLWILYLLPVAIIIVGIVASALLGRRRERP